MSAVSKLKDSFEKNKKDFIDSLSQIPDDKENYLEWYTRKSVVAWDLCALFLGARNDKFISNKTYFKLMTPILQAMKKTSIKLFLTKVIE